MRKIKNVIRPLIESEVSLKNQRLILHEMFATAVANAPENEIDNFSARKFSPVYLALCHLLENVRMCNRQIKNRRKLK